MKIEHYQAQITIERAYCKDCDQEMVALKKTFYTYKCPLCGKEENKRDKYPKMVIE